MESVLIHAIQTLLFQKEYNHLSLLGCTHISSQLCGIVRDFYNLYGVMPSLEELILFHFKECSPECEYYTPLELAMPVLHHTLIDYGVFISCRLLHFFLVFHFTEGRYPRADDILENSQDTEEWTEMMHQQVDEYWQHKVSDVKINDLVRTVSEMDIDSCPICQEPILKGQTIIRLPCDHVFHATSTECDGVEEWLKRSNACPLCKKECTAQEHSNRV
jgi:hypothetical protein